MNAKDSRQSTTRSGISPAQVTITDEASQVTQTGKTAAQTLANLNRNTQRAHEPIVPVFNEEEIKARFGIIGALTTEVNTFVQLKAKELQHHEDKLEQLIQAEEAGEGISSEQVGQILELQDKIIGLEKWAPGGIYRQATTAFTLAASGNVMGTDGQFLQAAAVNYLQSLGAEQIKKLSPQLGGEGSPVHAAFHAILACGGAAAQNQDCGQAAMGASAGVVLNKLLGEAKDLTVEEKEARRNIVSTIVAGAAQMAGSNDVSAAVTAVQIETENNFLPALVIAAAAWSAYDFYVDAQEINEGRKTLEEVIKEKGLLYAIGLTAGPLGKAGSKIVGKMSKKGVEKTLKKSDDDITAYISKKPGTEDVQYIGITNNLKRRYNEHLRTKGIEIEKFIEKLSKSDAKAVEQALIEIHKLGKDGGILLNKINSISTKNPSYADQLKKGYEILKSIGFK